MVAVVLGALGPPRGTLTLGAPSLGGAKPPRNGARAEWDRGGSGRQTGGERSGSFLSGFGVGVCLQMMSSSRMKASCPTRICSTDLRRIEVGGLRRDGRGLRIEV